MSRVVIDTVVLAAIVDTRDKWHLKATALSEGLLAAKAELAYFDVVVNETISILTRRLREQKRATQLDEVFERLESIVPRSRISWISSKIRNLYPEILELIREHKGELNFNDALLALVCHDNAIRYIASFDRDFDQIAWLTRIDTPEKIPQDS